MIAAWIKKDELSVTAQETLEARLAQLGGMEPVNWVHPYITQLRNCARISEIRFDVDNRQHRIFGFFGPNRHEYTMLLGWIKKGKSGYSKQCKTAINRARIVNVGGRRYIREHGT